MGDIGNEKIVKSSIRNIFAVGLILFIALLCRLLHFKYFLDVMRFYLKKVPINLDLSCNFCHNNLLQEQIVHSWAVKPDTGLLAENLDLSVLNFTSVYFHFSRTCVFSDV